MSAKSPPRRHRSVADKARRVALLGPPMKLLHIGNALGSLHSADRLAYLRERERSLISLPPEPKPPTMFERFGARAITGVATMIETPDGRKLGSAYGGSGAAFNRMVTKPGKPKIKGRKKTEAELQAAMRDDMTVARKQLHQRDDTLLPAPWPDSRQNNARLGARLRMEKKTKSTRPPRHGGPHQKGSTWDRKVRVTKKRKSS
jgi:hypothetical protein